MRIPDVLDLTHFIRSPFSWICSSNLERASLKPTQDLMNKFKKKWLLKPSEQLSVKYLSIFAIFMKIFSKIWDSTPGVSRRMKWVNICILITSSDKVLLVLTLSWITSEFNQFLEINSFLNHSFYLMYKKDFGFCWK